MEDLDPRDWKLALRELFQGQDAAAKLLASLFLLHEDDDGSPTLTQEDLARMVVSSFSKALSLLGYCDSAKSDGTASCCLASTDATLPGPKPVVGGKINKRGRYNSWKSCNSWSETTPALIDDGHVWRKYGQKPIHGSDFPRSYFRCTHKFDQKCEAAKQVQQISRNPRSYQTTYFGRHTCKNTSVPSPFILDVSNPKEGMAFNVISFDGTAARNMEDDPFFSSTFFSNSRYDEALGRARQTSLKIKEHVDESDERAFEYSDYLLMN